MPELVPIRLGRMLASPFASYRGAAKPTTADLADRVALVAYLGGSDAFDQVIVELAEAYVDQNASDYATFNEAARTGQIEAGTGI